MKFLSTTLARVKPSPTIAVTTKAGEMKASVEFRFSQRLGDATTAHEEGIFRYAATGEDGKENAEYIHFEALLLKREGRWSRRYRTRRRRARFRHTAEHQGRGYSCYHVR